MNIHSIFIYVFISGGILLSIYFKIWLPLALTLMGLYDLLNHKIPQKYQHRVLFWGILGAIIFRALMIFFGVLLINKFSFTTYVFGAFLIFTAYRMLVSKDESFNPKKSFVYKQIRRFIPITSKMNGEHFFIKLRHITAATPLFIALIIIEFTDELL